MKRGWTWNPFGKVRVPGSKRLNRPPDDTQRTVACILGIVLDGVRPRRS